MRWSQRLSDAESILFASERAVALRCYLNGSNIRKRWYQQLWYVVKLLAPVRYSSPTSLHVFSTNIDTFGRHTARDMEELESREAVVVPTHVLLQRYTLLDLTTPCFCRPTDIASSSLHQLPPRLSPNMLSSRQ